MKVYQKLASKLIALENCVKSNNSEWEQKHNDAIDAIVKTGPSGSGWDLGTKLMRDSSNDSKLVFHGGYHHMNDGGMYDGWTEHTIIVKPSLAFGITLRVTGHDRNDIKDYLTELFDCWLNSEVTDNLPYKE